MEQSVRIIGISGSLRKQSFNKAVLESIREIMPEGMDLEIADISQIPHYNGDLDLPAAASRPEPVQQFREKLAKADGILIVSPEYNYSIPGFLKNAIDWASRGEDSPLMNKPVSVMGATPGMWGTIRMQMAFKPIFQYLNMPVVLKPEILIAKVKEKLDENRKLNDPVAIDLIKQNLNELRNLIRKRKH